MASWLSWCSKTFSIDPLSSATKLPNSGKELLELSLERWQKIPGGKVLARHLGYLRLQSTGVCSPDLLQEQKVDGESYVGIKPSFFSSSFVLVTRPVHSRCTRQFYSLHIPTRLEFHVLVTRKIAHTFGIYLLIFRYRRNFVIIYRSSA